MSYTFSLLIYSFVMTIIFLIFRLVNKYKTVKAKRKIMLDAEQVSILLRFENAKKSGVLENTPNIEKYLKMSPFIRKGKFVEVTNLIVKVLDKGNDRVKKLLDALPDEYNNASVEVQELLDDYAFFIGSVLIYKHFWAYAYIHTFRRIKVLRDIPYYLVCVFDWIFKAISSKIPDTFKEVTELKERPERKFDFSDDFEYFAKA